GVVPACRTLDTVSVFALTAADAATVAQVARGFDPGDPFSRDLQPSPRRGWSCRPSVRVAVPLPAQREFFGNDAYAAQFDHTIVAVESLGASLVEVDIEPLLETARMLYGGPWVAERYLAAGDL